ncbi:SCO3242 family prenyltransferase [Frankia sp. Cppng1_Ct_nod]|uniref:SCO3242 family prenyltransferase n=1 Tax=Frankia sp. Cppng1_Ct_nod TaxID=2897162 RepID=UPI001040E93E|nr:UbiA family prenyltransferase [Frankia sp. Cppng1_Ct_nod]
MKAVADLSSLVELVRAPAALTVPGDSLSGAAAADREFGPAAAGLALASVFLYWGGMALNDVADRDVDVTERPHRPIPSGRVTPRAAFALASGLTAAGVGVAGLAGGRSALAVAVPLAGVVWAYDLVLKPTRLGPAAMATARALDVLLGAGSRRRRSLPVALVVAGHTVLVTELSRREVEGCDSEFPKATLVGTGLVALGAAAATRRSGGCVPRLVGLGLLGTYAATFGAAQVAVVRDPQPAQVQRAVGAGILGLLPLQAAVAARSGALGAAALLTAAFPWARALSRRVSPT